MNRVGATTPAPARSGVPPQGEAPPADEAQRTGELPRSAEPQRSGEAPPARDPLGRVNAVAVLLVVVDIAALAAAVRGLPWAWAAVAA
ncbi:MAG: hypothetical protein HOY78_05150, partial [Saccharothrix sp.]|nr:hypothetical protein [Saccharothrix sp.]